MQTPLKTQIYISLFAGVFAATLKGIQLEGFRGAVAAFRAMRAKKIIDHLLADPAGKVSPGKEKTECLIANRQEIESKVQTILDSILLLLTEDSTQEKP